MVTTFKQLSDPNDWIRNIGLFMPLGWSLTRLWQQQPIKRSPLFFLTLATSCGLSLAIEGLQIFLPGRSPTLADIIMNTMGGVLGYLTSLVLLRSRHILSSPKGLALGFTIYLTLVVGLILALHNTASLSNWDPTLPLLVGNEGSGNRPWQGSISQLIIAKKAISNTEANSLLTGELPVDLLGSSLLSNYDFSRAETYQDLVGYSPNLMWAGELPQRSLEDEASIDSVHWLTTKTNPIALNQSLKKSSEFTIITAITSSDLSQTGPARIISISKDIHHRNLTIGQQGQQLTVRLRTPITGKNGHLLSLSVPNAFTNHQLRQWIVTYKKPILKVYGNPLVQPATLNLSVDTTLFRYLLPLENIETYISNSRGQGLISFISRLLFYGLIFIPLGLILGFTSPVLSSHAFVHNLLYISIVFLPSLIIEIALVKESNQLVRIDRLLVGAAVITIGTVMASYLSKRRQHRTMSNKHS